MKILNNMLRKMEKQVRILFTNVLLEFGGCIDFEKGFLLKRCSFKASSFLDNLYL